MRVIIVSLFLLLYSYSWAIVKDSVLVAAHKTRQKEVIFHQNSRIFIKLNDGSKYRGRLHIINDSVVAVDTTIIPLSYIKFVAHDHKIVRIIFYSFLGSDIFTFLITVIWAILEESKALWQPAFTISFSLDLPGWLVPLFFTIVLSILTLFLGIMLRLFTKRYRKNKYNFIVR